VVKIGKGCRGETLQQIPIQSLHWGGKGRWLKRNTVKKTSRGRRLEERGIGVIWSKNSQAERVYRDARRQSGTWERRTAQRLKELEKKKKV